MGRAKVNLSTASTSVETILPVTALTRAKEAREVKLSIASFAVALTLHVIAPKGAARGKEMAAVKEKAFVTTSWTRANAGSETSAAIRMTCKVPCKGQQQMSGPLKKQHKF